MMKKMKVYAPDELIDHVKAYAEAEYEGNFSQAVRRLLVQALRMNYGPDFEEHPAGE